MRTPLAAGHSVYAEEQRDAVSEDSNFTGNSRGILIFTFDATLGVGVSDLEIQRNQCTNSSHATVQVQIHNFVIESGLEIDDNEFSRNVALRMGNLGLIHASGGGLTAPVTARVVRSSEPYGGEGFRGGGHQEERRHQVQRRREESLRRHGKGSRHKA